MNWNNVKIILVCLVGVVVGVAAFLTVGKGHYRVEQPGMPRSNNLMSQGDDPAKKLDKMRIIGIRHLSDRNYALAVKLFLQLNFLNIYDEFPYRQLSRVALEIGNERFNKLFSEAIISSPNAERKEMIMGAVYYATGDQIQATHNLNAYLEKNPGDVPALFYLGAVEMKKGDHKRAIEMLSKVVELQPSYYYAYLELQKAYEKTGDMEMSSKMTELALANSPVANKDAVCHGVDLDDTKKAELVENILKGN